MDNIARSSLSALGETVSDVSVRNFSRYQHYKNRRPLWIKLYLAIKVDRDFKALSCESRILFIYLLLLAAEHDNRIPADPGWLAVEAGMKPRAISKALAELLAGSYIVASNRASDSACLETETETETEHLYLSTYRTTTNAGGSS